MTLLPPSTRGASRRTLAAGGTTCPACGAESFSKQVTAAGFQLKGSGWYVTDFRGGSGGAAATGAAAASAPAAAEPAKSDSGDSGGGSSEASASSSTPCGGSCACH